MSSESFLSPPMRALLAGACLVVIAAALQQAREIVVPFLLACFIAIACDPAMLWLHRKRVPKWAAISLIILALLALGASLAALIGASVTGFRQALPDYYAQLQQHETLLLHWLEQLGFADAQTQYSQWLDPAFFLNLVAEILSGFGSLLTNTMLILLTVVFLLLEGTELPRKIQQAFPKSGSNDAFAQFTASVHRYLAAKTLTSLLTGGLVTALLMLLGVHHAVLWGLLAFLLNYIPNIGSILAAVPAILLGWLQLGPYAAAGVLAGYVVINFGVGQILEPRVMGHRLDLSALVVFLSLVFWGWLLGAVGMLLSIPLTIIIKLALESSPRTRSVAALLSPASNANRQEGSAT